MLKLTTEEFIQKSKEVHENRYDYSLTNYIGSRINVTIVCPEHGPFQQLPCNHLDGRGCPECGKILQKLKVTHTKEDFEQKAIEVHGYKYNYSEVNYRGVLNGVTIICPKHGPFIQKPTHHLWGCGCPQCGIDDQTLTSENFINRSNELHNHKYDYSKVNYVNCLTEIEIICPIHGIFKVSPHNHMYNESGCPRCTHQISKPEQELFNLISSWGLNPSQSDRSILNGKEVDIYIPEKKVAIEFNGAYWHTTEFKDKNYHYQKSLECEKAGIRLIHVWEWLWNNPTKRKVLINIIKSACGIIDQKIFARKCTTEFVDLKTCSRGQKEEIVDFFNENNVNGYRASTLCTLLRYQGKIVHAFSWAKPYWGSYEWELIRGASLLGYSVIGGSSRLWKLFKDRTNPKSVVYYIDYNFFNGNSLEYLPFKYKDHTLSFWNYWLESGEVKNRQPAKHKEIMELTRQGLVIPIYGAGTKTFIYNLI
jgi:hypothetical protein